VKSDRDSLTSDLSRWRADFNSATSSDRSAISTFRKSLQKVANTAIFCTAVESEHYDQYRLLSLLPKLAIFALLTQRLNDEENVHNLICLAFQSIFFFLIYILDYFLHFYYYRYFVLSARVVRADA